MHAGSTDTADVLGARVVVGAARVVSAITGLSGNACTITTDLQVIAIDVLVADARTAADNAHESRVAVSG